VGVGGGEDRRKPVKPPEQAVFFLPPARISDNL